MDCPEEINLMGTVFRKKMGEGTLTFLTLDNKEKTLPCQFCIVQYHDGKIRVFCNIQAKRNLPSLGHPILGISGQTADGYKAKIDITKAISIRGSFFVGKVNNVTFTFREEGVESQDSFRLEFPVTNLDSPIDQDEAARVAVAIEGTSFSFSQTGKRTKPAKYTKEPMAVSCGSTLIMDKSEIKKVRDLFSELCIVISLLQGTRVNYLGYMLRMVSGRVLEEYWFNGITGDYTNNPLIYHLLEQRYITIKQWVSATETMFSEYRKIGKEYHLYAVIASFIGVVADKKDFINSRGLRVSGAAEIIRYQHARIEGLEGSCFYKIFKKLSKKISYQTPDSKDISENERRKRTNDSIKTFVAIRNKLVHEGDYCLTAGQDETDNISSRYEQYQFMVSFMAGLLATLLGLTEIAGRKIYMPEAVSIPK